MANLFLQIGGYLRIIVEVGLLAFSIYYGLLFVRGTRAVTIMAGIAILIITMSFMSQFLGLEVIEWILMRMWTFLALSVLIIFQPEIRRALAQLGSSQQFLRLHSSTKREKELISTLLASTFFLAEHRIGALFAIERRIGTRAFAETGTAINAPVTQELLTTIFFPNTPLHDGGVIIRNGHIAAAGCIFPLTQSPDLSSSLGTRHRAGVGITEETDAVAIIVSEESGAVSLAYGGRLIRGIKRKRLERHLHNYLVKKRLPKKRGQLLTPVSDASTGLTGTSKPGEEPVNL